MPYPIPSIVVAMLAAFAVATALGWLAERAGFPLPASNGRMGCVDGLRGYLALAVLGHHYIVWIQVIAFGGAWTAPSLPVFNQLGAGAVGLFFMTTGLVFYRRVLTGLRDTSWTAVYITRAFRILPLLILSVVAVTAVAMSRTGGSLRIADLPALARWITTWGEPGLVGDPDAGRINAYVLWSLWFEWLFYIFVLPACAALSDVVRGRLPSLAVPSALMAIAGLAMLPIPHLPPLLHFLPLFAAGMYAYEVRQRPAVAAWMRSRLAACIAVVGLLASVLTFPFPVSWALPAFMFFFFCVSCGNSIFGVLNTRGALVLGEISFSIYLLHGIVLSLFFVEGEAMTRGLATSIVPLFLPGMAIAVVLLACCTYLGVERPAMRLGSRLAAAWSRLRISSRSPEVEVAP